MDSPPCPDCDRNKNGIFTVLRSREKNRYLCEKCGSIFDGPSPEKVRQERLHRHKQRTKHEPE